MGFLGEVLFDEQHKWVNVGPFYNRIDVGAMGPMGAPVGERAITFEPRFDRDDLLARRDLVASAALRSSRRDVDADPDARAPPICWTPSAAGSTIRVRARWESDTFVSRANCEAPNVMALLLRVPGNAGSFQWPVELAVAREPRRDSRQAR